MSWDQDASCTGLALLVRMAVCMVMSSANRLRRKSGGKEARSDFT